MRRGRDADIAEYGYDGSKRRRLNDEPGASRRPPSDFPPAIASLPAKPSFPPDSSSIDASHRKRAPLPPQDQEWRENMNQPSVPGPPSYVPVVGARYDRPPENVGRKVYDVPLDRRDDRLRPPLEDGPSGPRRAGRSPLREVDTDHSTRPQPTGPNERSERRSRFDAPPPPPDRMDVDAPPPSRAPPPARLIGGGMHADRMLAEPPRGPRAMAPRDGPFTAHGSISSSVSAPAMSAPYNARAGAPMTDNVSNDRGRGRSGPSLPAGERRWETNDSGRRESFSGPPGEPLGVPPRRIDDRSGPPRDLLDRPRVSSSAADDRRGDRSLSRMTGTNNVLTGGRPSGYASDTSAPNAMHSPVERYRAADNAFGDPSRFIAPGEPEPFDRRRQQRPPPDLPPPRSSRDRRSSVTQDVGIRPRGPDPVPDRPMIALPPRPRETLRDNAPPRQSRFGPPGAPPSEPPDLAPRIWQTRDEAQNARTQEARPNDGRGPRDEVRPPREGNAWESHPEPASQRWWPGNRDRYAGGPGGSENAGPRTRSPEIPLRRRASPPPPPAVTEGRRYDDQAIERPGTNKVHPSRAPLVEEVPTHEAFGRAPRPNRPRYPDRSPEQGYADRMRRGDIDRDLPPRPAEDAYLAPPRDRSPSSSQNDLRPNMRRGGSLLERLSLDDDVARHDGGSSLRERVDIASHGNNDEAAFAHADSMDVDADGNPLLDDPFKGGGRGQGRRRGGKPKRGRRNGA
ncbi:hypothetical protein C8Q78DRAFT_609124 [Trametes maxima]|nr:hypothetical protein C8Q78DRAFT_609124 [Trametes maxima]